jgi:hypothetical protein
MKPAIRQTMILILVLPTIGSAQDSTTTYPIIETVELSVDERDALLVAPSLYMNDTPSVELGEAIRVGTIDKLRVEKVTGKVVAEIAEEIGRDTVTSYQGWIRYTPVAQSESRLYRPVILCVSEDALTFWVHCQDASYTRLQTSGMAKPIRFNGDLSDEEVDEIFDAIDNAALVSTTDDQPVTPQKIYEIIKYPHAGNRINVYVRTEKRGFTDVIFLRRDDDDKGRSKFVVTEFRCGAG